MRPSTNRRQYESAQYESAQYESGHSDRAGPVRIGTVRIGTSTNRPSTNRHKMKEPKAEPWRGVWNRRASAPTTMGPEDERAESYTPSPNEPGSMSSAPAADTDAAEVNTDDSPNRCSRTSRR